MSLCSDAADGDDDDRHLVVTLQHTPGGEEDDHPEQQREVRVPWVSEHRESVSEDREPDECCHSQLHTDPSDSAADPDCSKSGRCIEQRTAQFHTPSPPAREEVERLRKVEIDETLTEMKSLAQDIAENWTSDKSGVELIAEQRR